MSNEQKPAAALGPLPEPAIQASPMYYPTSIVTTADPGPMYPPLYTADQMRAYAAEQVAAERERLAADITVLALAVGSVSTALDELIGACMDDFMDPKAPSRRMLMHARSMLPPACEHALKKAPAGEKT